MIKLFLIGEDERREITINEAVSLVENQDALLDAIIAANGGKKFNKEHMVDFDYHVLIRRCK